MKKTRITVNESRLRGIVEKAIARVLNEGVEPAAYDDANHTYTEKEMQWLYDNQDGLSDIQRKVLNAGMWWRARMANYNGYVEQWPNIVTKDGAVFYYDDNGSLKQLNERVSYDRYGEAHYDNEDEDDEEFAMYTSRGKTAAELNEDVPQDAWGRDDYSQAYWDLCDEIGEEKMCELVTRFVGCGSVVKMVWNYAKQMDKRDGTFEDIYKFAQREGYIA